MTGVPGLNMKNAERYGANIEKANPTYVEVKAYTHVGFSRLRLGFESMPGQTEIRESSVQKAGKTGYRIIDESTESGFILLSRLVRAAEFGDG